MLVVPVLDESVVTNGSEEFSLKLVGCASLSTKADGAYTFVF